MSLLTRRIFTTLCLSLAVAATVRANTSESQDAAPAKPRPLRSLARAARTKTLNVGYFGGSITEGSGASNGSKTSWRAKTTAFLKEKLPDITVTEINAAIGGTGSDLGAFRIQRDLLAKKPDLVFVEFAVNDFGRNEERTIRAMEGIVRAIWKANPEADILFVYTATKAMDDAAYTKGQLPTSVTYHHKVAIHYDIDEIQVGEALVQTVHKDHAGDWLKLTTDNVHPNDAGYTIYTDRVTAFLTECLTDKRTPPPPKRLTAPFLPNPLEYGKVWDAWELPDITGWEKDPATLAGRFPHRLSASKPGTELKVPFTGNAIALYWLIAPDSGDLEWKIDSGDWKKLSSWDRYALRFTRAGSAVLSDSLAPGKHELTLRIAESKNAESTGTYIRIGAILLNEAPALQEPEVIK